MADKTRVPALSQVATVFVPVADQDRALTFYLEKLGFDKRVDFVYGGGIRWVEVAPRGSTFALALVPRQEGVSAGNGETHCALTSKNIDEDYAVLRARGVDVDEEIARKGNSRPGIISIAARVTDPVPPQFFFRDLDGNRFLVVGSN
jgi:catechol 2,3-dioxygenase-like lactoylglutathione lyase family enzyme